MLGNKLASSIFKKMSSMGINLKVPNQDSYFQTIKDFLLDSKNMNDFAIQNLTNFYIDVAIDDYNGCLLVDYHSARERIIQQKNNLEVLYKNSMQPAWIIITAYYCNFFIANELSKLYGRYIVNFSRKEMSTIIKQSNYSAQFILRDLDENNSYEVEVSNSEYDNFVRLKFNKKSPKPHKIVWENLSKLIKDIIADVTHEKLLFENIIKGDNNWQNPSQIRNNWNYRYSEYYSTKGNALGSNFLKIISNKSSTLNHFNNRRIQPTDINLASSIAFIYYLLLEAFEDIDRKFENL